MLAGQELMELESPMWPRGPAVDWSNRVPCSGIHKCQAGVACQGRCPCHALTRPFRTRSMYRDLIRVRRNMDGNTLGLTATYVRVHHLHLEATVMAYHRWHKVRRRGRVAAEEE